MLKKIDYYIINYSKPRIIWLLAGVSLLFNFILFPLMASHGGTPLDLNYFYSADEAYLALNQFTELEQNRYFINECTNDVIYPLIYTSFLCLSIYRLFGKLSFARLPIFILIFDYMENTGILILLYNFPERLDTIAYMTGVFSGIKWLAAIFNIFMLLSGVFLLLFKKLKRA
ncbi:MAG: hypothetical protein H3C31_10270 [Brumimicrobium sp.]|nr:hypothetical protein [Brumimicrobium sp.]MCO5269103.1 hypothetical protein [Brumimicrobium sp.]